MVDRTKAKNPPRIDGSLIIPNEGDRAFVGGPTGSGKSLVGKWLVRRIETAPAIIYDTKREPEFLTLPKARLVTEWDRIDEAIEDGVTEYVIFRPDRYIATNPAKLDEFLMEHLERFPRIGAVLDEGYRFHNNGRAGPGLTSLMTEGRSNGITAIVMSQRPAWISLFVLTEAQHFYLFDLAHDDDKKRIGKVIPGYEDLPDPPEFHFYYYSRKTKMPPVLMPPIALDKEPRQEDNASASKSLAMVPRHSWIGRN